MAIPENIKEILKGYERPKDLIALEEELDAARAKGYNIPDAPHDKEIITKEQAIKALDTLNLSAESLFAQLMKEYRAFPLGQGEEIYALDQIIEEKESQFHEDEYPGIYDKFLQISSIEGEGSYFYEIATGIVYDTDWGEEESMMAGTLEKKWPSFLEFFEWYYSNVGKNA